ncbi:MAG: hypothetical protein EOP49_19230 [Sphingobacteriales bacterium]|nr:MAG: hypothetical protein EOP49_19230 [Sphingobacteriales bacterium]
MKPLYALLLAVFTLAGLQSSAQQWKARDFKKLKAVVGSWEATTKTGFAQEKWVKKNDTAFTGQAYSSNRGVVLLEENLQLVLSGNEIHYITTIRHQNKGLPVTFKLVSVKDDTYTFENKEHDYPQQIVYYFKSGKHMDATISGPTENGPKTVAFHYERKLR